MSTIGIEIIRANTKLILCIIMKGQFSFFYGKNHAKIEKKKSQINHRKKPFRKAEL